MTESSSSKMLSSIQVSRQRTEGSHLSDTEASLPPTTEESMPDLAIATGMPTKESGKLTDEEHLEMGRVSWKIYGHYIHSMSITFSAVSVAFYLSSWASSVGSNLWLRDWTREGPQDTAQRNLRLGVYFVLGLLQAICIYVAAIIATLGVRRATKYLHNGMLLSVLHATMAFFDTTPLGRIVSRFSRDIDIMDLMMPHVVRPFLNNTTQLISIIIVVVMGAPIILPVAAVLSVVYYFLQRFYIRTARQLKRLESVSRSPIYSHFSVTISGISVLRAYRLQEAFVADSMKRVDANHEALFPGVVANRWLALRLELIANSVIFFAILFVLLRRDSIDPGTVGLTISYAIQITTILNNVVRLNADMENNMVAVERIKQYSEIAGEAPWNLPKTQPSADWPREGKIQFQSYSTAYREGLSPVLQRITCNIHQGEKIGIVGRTGAGKSSLTLALFRIIEASEGSIVIDGQDISQLGLHNLRSRLTIIPQDPVLFSCSLRTNLDPLDEYTDQEIWKALELAHLKDYVASLPGGLQYQVAEGGENLSVGQCQLVCLARALLRKTRILILDEATAAVDMETDDIIQATIRREFASCTVLTIAHRLNTIMDSNRIIVLDKGKIREFDTPWKLLENENSLFCSMAKDAGLV